MERRLGTRNYAIGTAGRHGDGVKRGDGATHTQRERREKREREKVDIRGQRGDAGTGRDGDGAKKVEND